MVAVSMVNSGTRNSTAAAALSRLPAPWVPVMPQKSPAITAGSVGLFQS